MMEVLLVMIVCCQGMCVCACIDDVNRVNSDLEKRTSMVRMEFDHSATSSCWRTSEKKGIKVALLSSWELNRESAFIIQIKILSIRNKTFFSLLQKGSWISRQYTSGQTTLMR